MLTGVNALTVTSPDPDLWTVARTRQSKFQENTLLTNQTNITANLAQGSMQHAITGGIEFISEEQYNPTYVGLGTPIPAANVYNPNRHDPLPGYAPTRNGVYTRGETQTFGAYLFDTLTFNDHWQAIAGVRIDSYDTNFDSAVLSTATSHPTLPVGTLVPASLQTDDILFSYKVGVVFKPAAEWQRLSFACHLEPAPGRRQLRTQQCGQQRQQPEPRPAEGREPRARHEVGPPRWLAGAERRHLLELQRERTRGRSGRPHAGHPDGQAHRRGYRARHRRQLTSNWEISAGVAKMDTEIEQGLNNQAGLQIVWSPEFTFTSWTTYRTPIGLSIGGGARYVDSVIRPVTTNGVPPPANATNMRVAPDYWVVDAMLGYEINEKIQLQLNAYNLTDEVYAATLNNSGARYSPGTPRSALLTVNFSF